MHLVDLNPIDMEPEPAFNAMNDVRFLLFTRRNQNSAQVLTHNMNTVQNSNWVNGNGVRFIIHGWNSNANTAMNTFMRNDFLAAADLNVVGGFACKNSNQNVLTLKV
jgi:Lipase